MKKPSITAVKTKDLELNRVLNAVKELMEIREGDRGDPKDAFVSFRDLIDSGIVTLSTDATSNSTRVGISVPTALSGKPNDPTDLEATSNTFTNILLTWGGTDYTGHGYTEIYRHTTIDRSGAIKIGSITGTMFSDSVGYDSDYYYWIRFVSTTGVRGNFNAVDGVRGNTLKSITDVIEDAIGEAPFGVVGNKTYISDALIKDARIESIIAESIAADRIVVSDSFQAFRATMGDIQANVIHDVNNRFIINLGVGTLGVFDDNGNLRVKIGNLTVDTVATAANYTWDAVNSLPVFSIWDNAANFILNINTYMSSGTSSVKVVDAAVNIEITDTADYAQGETIYGVKSGVNTTYSIRDTAATLEAGTEAILQAAQKVYVTTLPTDDTLLAMTNVNFVWEATAYEVAISDTIELGDSDVRTVAYEVAISDTINIQDSNVRS